MNRRVVLATGVLLAAATLSSCSTFSRTETAAEVDGVRLSRTELNTLTGDATDGDAVRKVIGHLASRGRTIVILAHDPNIVRGAHAHIDAMLEAHPFTDVVIWARNIEKAESLASRA